MWPASATAASRRDPCSPEQCVGLRGLVPLTLAGLAERLLGSRPAEGEQAAALAEQGVGALGTFPNSCQRCGRFGVEGCRLGVVAGVLGELGAGGAEGVLVERVAGLEPVGEPLGERGIAGGERGSHHRGQLSRVVGRLAGARYLLELGEQGGRPLGRLRRERGCGGGQSATTTISAAPIARVASISQSIPRLRAPLAAGEAARELDRAKLDQRVPVAARLGEAAASRPARSSASSGARALPAGGGSCLEHRRRLGEAALLAEGDPLLEGGEGAGRPLERVAGDGEVVLQDGGVLACARSTSRASARSISARPSASPTVHAGIAAVAERARRLGQAERLGERARTVGGGDRLA